MQITEKIIEAVKKNKCGAAVVIFALGAYAITEMADKAFDLLKDVTE